MKEEELVALERIAITARRVVAAFHGGDGGMGTSVFMLTSDLAHLDKLRAPPIAAPQQAVQIVLDEFNLDEHEEYADLADEIVEALRKKGFM